MSVGRKVVSDFLAPSKGRGSKARGKHFPVRHPEQIEGPLLCLPSHSLMSKPSRSGSRPLRHRCSHSRFFNCQTTRQRPEPYHFSRPASSKNNHLTIHADIRLIGGDQKAGALAGYRPPAGRANLPVSRVLARRPRPAPKRFPLLGSEKQVGALSRRSPNRIANDFAGK